MIRGTTAQFKFHMPYKFEELCIIEVTFWQPGNDGTAEAPLPIVRVYNQQAILAEKEPSDEWADETKVYSYNNKYYKKEGGTWISSETMDSFIRNDGLAPDADDPKTVVTSLTPEETLRFSDKSKGYVQVKAYCEVRGITFGSKPERFMVYPVASEDVFGDIGQSVEPNTGVQILDAGEIG